MYAGVTTDCPDTTLTPAQALAHFMHTAVMQMQPLSMLDCHLMKHIASTFSSLPVTSQRHHWTTFHWMNTPSYICLPPLVGPHPPPSVVAQRPVLKRSIIIHVLCCALLSIEINYCTLLYFMLTASSVSIPQLHVHWQAVHKDCISPYICVQTACSSAYHQLNPWVIMMALMYIYNCKVHALVSL